METNTVNSKKIILTNGVLLGLLSILLSIVMYILGLNPKNFVYGVLGFLFMVFFIVYGMMTFKKENNTYMSFGQALKIGLGISLIAGIIGALYQFVFINYIDTEFMKNLLDAQNQEMIQKNPQLTQEQLDMIKKSQEFMTSPVLLFFIGIIQSIFFGFIISLIAGLAMKKTEDSF